jgi:3-hydroxy-3-methylglutaryl CoA synthase
MTMQQCDDGDPLGNHAQLKYFISWVSSSPSTTSVILSTRTAEHYYKLSLMSSFSGCGAAAALIKDCDSLATLLDYRDTLLKLYAH